jgi:hypothetical protein
VSSARSSTAAGCYPAHPSAALGSRWVERTRNIAADRRVQQRPFDLTRATHCADIGGKTPESGGGKVT